MVNIEHLEVYLDAQHVGTLALYKKTLAAFEYTSDWINRGFSVSPFSLPLKSGVYVPKFDPFNGLFGIFYDSLPDGWGRLLVDRMMLREHINPASVNVLERLSFIGLSGMGALEYHPVQNWSNPEEKSNYDYIAEECRKILASVEPDDLDTIYKMGGSSGGARPKILIRLDGDDWIVKFPSSYDSNEIGQMEYDYSLCAQRCGIRISEVRLLESKNCSGYFATKRFDRKRDEEGNVKKVHMASVSALLETSHRVPALDYNSLMALTWQLTKNYTEMEKLFRQMCFNVFSHNRDDHSKNFTYVYDNGSWNLSPAYDLTYSNSVGGEHATTINGNGKDPGIPDIMSVAARAGLEKKRTKEIAEEIQCIVNEDLGKYLQ